MTLIVLLAVATIILPLVLIDQYLLACSERFIEENRTEMSRFRALLA